MSSDIKLAWLVRVFDTDDEVLFTSLPSFYHSARRIVYMEVEEE